MQIQENVLLAPYTTLGVGGPARWFAQVHSELEVQEALEKAHEKRWPIFVLGGGSNLVVSDAGWPGLVVHVALRGITMTEKTGSVLFSSGAGEEWDNLVARTVAEDCAGLECLSGIPGTVGGTPVQNVGAYGQDISTTLAHVRAIELSTGKFFEFSNKECEFAYRHSRFNTTDRNRFLVLNVSFALARGGRPHIEYADLRKFFADRQQSPRLSETRDAVLEIRRKKAMLIVEGDEDARSAGSFFKNPVVSLADYERIAAIAVARGITLPHYPSDDGRVKIPAAWLIEQSGMHKGFTRGRVGISRKHALALVNRGGATAADVCEFRDLVQQKVLDSFGVELLTEPVFVGFEQVAAV